MTSAMYGVDNLQKIKPFVDQRKKFSARSGRRIYSKSFLCDLGVIVGELVFCGATPNHYFKQYRRSTVKIANESTHWQLAEDDMKRVRTIRLKEKIEESDKDEPSLRCFTQLDWKAAEKVISLYLVY